MKRPNIRILVADDHSVVREGIRALLEREPDMTVVGESGDGLEALAKFRELTPDIMLLDISMPDLDGLSALEQIGRDNPDARVMMVSALGQEAVVLEALRRGADYFLAKPYDEQRLLGAIDNALR